MKKNLITLLIADCDFLQCDQVGNNTTIPESTTPNIFAKTHKQFPKDLHFSGFYGKPDYQ